MSSRYGINKKSVFFLLIGFFLIYFFLNFIFAEIVSADGKVNIEEFKKQDTTKQLQLLGEESTLTLPQKKQIWDGLTDASSLKQLIFKSTLSKGLFNFDPELVSYVIEKDLIKLKEAIEISSEADRKTLSSEAKEALKKGFKKVLDASKTEEKKILAKMFLGYDKDKVLLFNSDLKNDIFGSLTEKNQGSLLEALGDEVQETRYDYSDVGGREKFKSGSMKIKNGKDLKWEGNKLTSNSGQGAYLNFDASNPLGSRDILHSSITGFELDGKTGEMSLELDKYKTKIKLKEGTYGQDTVVTTKLDASGNRVTDKQLFDRLFDKNGKVVGYMQELSLLRGKEYGSDKNLETVFEVTSESRTVSVNGEDKKESWTRVKIISGAESQSFVSTIDQFGRPVYIGFNIDNRETDKTYKDAYKPEVLFDGNGMMMTKSSKVQGAYGSYICDNSGLTGLGGVYFNGAGKGIRDLDTRIFQNLPGNIIEQMRQAAAGATENGFGEALSQFKPGNLVSGVSSIVQNIQTDTIKDTIELGTKYFENRGFNAFSIDVFTNQPATADYKEGKEIPSEDRVRVPFVQVSYSGDKYGLLNLNEGTDWGLRKIDAFYVNNKNTDFSNGNNFYVMNGRFLMGFNKDKTEFSRNAGDIAGASVSISNIMNMQLSGEGSRYAVVNYKNSMNLFEFGQLAEDFNTGNKYVKTRVYGPMGRLQAGYDIVAGGMLISGGTANPEEYAGLNPSLEFSIYLDPQIMAVYGAKGEEGKETVLTGLRSQSMSTSDIAAILTDTVRSNFEDEILVAGGFDPKSLTSTSQRQEALVAAVNIFENVKMASMDKIIELIGGTSDPQKNRDVVYEMIKNGQNPIPGVGLREFEAHYFWASIRDGTFDSSMQALSNAGALSAGQKLTFKTDGAYLNGVKIEGFNADISRFLASQTSKTSIPSETYSASYQVGELSNRLRDKINEIVNAKENAQTVLTQRLKEQQEKNKPTLTNLQSYFNGYLGSAGKTTTKTTTTTTPIVPTTTTQPVVTPATTPKATPAPITTPTTTPTTTGSGGKLKSGSTSGGQLICPGTSCDTCSGGCFTVPQSGK